MVLGPGPMPGMANMGPNPLMREEIIGKADAMAPMQFFAYQRVGQMPGHSTNILARLAQSGCCPGARAAGTKEVACANGQRYILENWEGGIRAEAVNGTRSDCEKVYEGTWMVDERRSGTSGCGCGGLGESTIFGISAPLVVIVGGLGALILYMMQGK